MLELGCDVDAIFLLKSIPGRAGAVAGAVEVRKSPENRIPASEANPEEAARLRVIAGNGRISGSLIRRAL